MPFSHGGALEHDYHQLRRRNRHHPATIRASEKRSGIAGDSPRPADVSQSRARDGQQSFAHAVRSIDRHDRQHGRLHQDREDRRSQEDAHRSGRRSARGRCRRASQEGPAVHAEYRDRQPHAGLGGMLSDERRPRWRGARSGEFVRDRDQMGESVGRVDGSLRDEEPRAPSLYQGQLRSRRHRVRDDVQAEADRRSSASTTTSGTSTISRTRSSRRRSRRIRASSCGRWATTS